MGQSSMFLTFRTICNFRGRTSALGRVGGGKGGIPGCSIPVYYEAFLKTQPAHNNEKRFISSNRVCFFQLTISPSDLLALILFLIQDCKNIP